MKLLHSLLLILGMTLLAGCMTATPDASQYSGWLKDYSNLTEYTTPTGGTSLRWIDPSLKKGKYHAIMIDRVTYYPAAQPSDQVSRKTLDQIPRYLNQQIIRELGPKFHVVSTPGPGVLRLRAAITGVDTPTEGLQAYEVIPVALIFAGVSTAAGTRDHNTVVYLEAEITDSNTGKVLGRVVRKGLGDTLEDQHAQLDLEHAKPVLDGWAKDGAAFARALIE